MASFGIAHLLLFSLCFAAFFAPNQCIRHGVERNSVAVKTPNGICGTRLCPDGRLCTCCLTTRICYPYMKDCHDRCPP